MPDAERSRYLFGSTDRADSAGLPWEGRSFDQSPASTDDGSADPALLAALTGFAQGTAGETAVVEKMQENVDDGRMRLLDLVE